MFPKVSTNVGGYDVSTQHILNLNDAGCLHTYMCASTDLPPGVYLCASTTSLTPTHPLTHDCDTWSNIICYCLICLVRY